MPLEGDERAVTVVIGAVLMFGILVTSLAMYQVNVVPDQNQGAEWDHHQEVTADLLDLRNAVVNAGYENSTRETAVSLGTQYESRTFSINPPDPQGTIRTNSTGNPQVVITSSGDEYRFNTSFVEYEPGYNEYDAPKTVIEHGLIYDEHGDVNITRDAGSVISDERIVIPLIEGDLSESSRSKASITVETIDVYHVSSDVDEIQFPTNAFEAWNESYDNVSESDGSAVYNPNSGQEVYIAQIAVGDDRSANDDTSDELDDFGDPVSNRGSSSETNEFGLAWQDGSVTGSPGETVTLTATIDADVENARADFSLRDPNGAVDSYSPTDPIHFDENGEATFDVTLKDRANDGDEVQVYVSSGGTTEKATLTVSDGGTENGFAVSIQNTNAPVSAGETLEVTADVSNTGSSEETQSITLDFANRSAVDSRSVTLAGGETRRITLSYDTRSSDWGQSTVVVSSEDDSANRSVSVRALDPVEVRDSGTLLVFRVANAANEQVTVERFEVDATTVMQGVTIDNGNAAEVSITRTSTQNGYANRNGNPNSFAADGTRYDIVTDSNKGTAGQYAIIEPEDDVDVDFRYFSADLGTLELTESPADADVTVTLTLSDGSRNTFYFEQV